MTRIVTALYDTMAEAELALAYLNSEVAIDDGDIVDHSPAGAALLERVKLSPEERRSCAREMADGGYLLIAQVKSGESADRIVKLLEDIPPDAMGKEPPADDVLELSATLDEADAAPPQTHADEEEGSPVAEGDLRLGRREVVRGGASVRVPAEAPREQDVESILQQAGTQASAASRRLGEEELEQGGLLRERMFEFTGTREEAIVSKHAFVREELVVRKSIERRTERVAETVRRTEVETEIFGGAEERPAFSGFAPSEQPGLRRRG